MKFIAHKTESSDPVYREQLLKDHLQGTAELAGRFAEHFGFSATGECLGLFHDIGKYSDKFQQRIRGSSIQVDHSTAGAQEIQKKFNNKSWTFLLSYILAGHHSGLPDSGTIASADDATLHSRLNKSVPDYSAYEAETDLPTNLEEKIASELHEFFSSGNKGGDELSLSFLVRFLFSSLVDADYLDTERFMQKNLLRQESVQVTELLPDLESYIERKGWTLPSNSKINQYRSQILNDCIHKGSNSDRGLFSLRVPTGAGKTVSSLAFSLHHARTNQMDRIIFIIPFTSIIEQNAAVFEEIIGEENVLEHHSNVDFGETEEFNPKRLATENWDAPLIVTTDVQFFESLFANRSSKCRKLHNLANSVLIFDEVQAITDHFLLPCIEGIEVLVNKFKCSAVFCTATQPELSQLTKSKSKAEEIILSDADLWRTFQRTTYEFRQNLRFDDLITQVNFQKQGLIVLCRKSEAQYLYEKTAAEGIYCLTANLTPYDRSRKIAEIKEKLQHPEQKCFVISTNLIEAGVDLDFPVVYREIDKLESIVQSGGRCNREGKREVSQSKTVIFKFSPMEQNHTEIKDESFRRRLLLTEEILQKGLNLEDPQTISAYFTKLYSITDPRFKDNKQILPMFKGLSMQFKTCAREFHLIEDQSVSIFIPFAPEAAELLAKIRENKLQPIQFYRKLGKFSVSVSKRVAKTMLNSKVIVPLLEGSDHFLLTNSDQYSSEAGLLDI